MFKHYKKWRNQFWVRYANHHRKMFLLVSFGVFLSNIATMMILAILIAVLYKFHVFQYFHGHNVVWFLLVLAIASMIVGCILSCIIIRIPVRTFDLLIQGMDELANGNYKIRLEKKGPNPVKNKVTDSFNRLAEELEHTEVLRSDFVNNFSHEFKTPIVSILGFARLLNRRQLPEASQKEYLGIIEEESDRLATLATNVLNLTKIENQVILTDVKNYNISEQIRTCILLLEKSWTKKNLRPQIDFNEYEYKGNEDLLKQVWINLLNNAVKFAEKNGEFGVTIREQGQSLGIWVWNTGSYIPTEEQQRIFRKFYQGDTSHSGEGTGTGLAIVQKVVELHKGTVSVESDKEKTSFYVSLPLEKKE